MTPLGSMTGSWTSKLETIIKWMDENPDNGYVQYVGKKWYIAMYRKAFLNK